jgi:predicted nucleotidyltransferase
MLNISIKVDLIYVFVFNFKTTVNKMPRKTREEILKLLSQNKDHLENRFKVRRMALFGSYARGDQKAESDVDIFEQIEQLLGLPVELVSRRAIKPNKLKYIEQDLIYV